MERKRISREDVLKSAYESVERKVDKKFKKKYGEDYDSSYYNRYSFKTQDEADAFSKYMADNGVSTQSLSKKVEGVYVVEIPKESDRNYVTDKEWLKKENTKNMGTIDTSHLAYHYGEVADSYVDRFKPEERTVNEVLYPSEQQFRHDQSLSQQATRAVERVFFGQLEGVNEIINDIHTAQDSVRMAADFIQSIKAYREESRRELDPDIQKQNNAIFTTGNIEQISYQNEGTVRIIGIKANGMPDYAVYINGRICEEGSAEYNNVLSLYNQRMESAQAIVNDTSRVSISNAVADGISIFNSEERRNNAQHVLNNAYNQTFSLEGQKSYFDASEAATLAAAINMENLSRSQEFRKFYDGASSFTAEDAGVVDRLVKEGKLSQGGGEVLAKGIGSNSGFDMSIDEREEAIKELHNAANNMFGMSARETEKINSFLSNAQTTGLGLVGLSIDPASTSDWQSVSSVLNRYTKTFSKADRQLVESFINNRQSLMANLKQFEEINAQIKNEQNPVKKSALEAKRNQLENEANALKAQVDEKKLENLMKEALGKAESNAQIQNNINNLVKKLELSDMEREIHYGNLHLRESFVKMDKALVAGLGGYGKGYDLLDFTDKVDLKKLSELSDRFQRLAIEKNIPIFTVTGKLDVTALKNLKPSEMKLLGLDSKTIDAMILLNDKRAFNKPKGYENKLQKKLRLHKQKMARLYQSAARNLRGLAQRIVGSDEDIGALLGNMYKVKKVVTGQHIRMVTAKYRQIRKFLGFGAKATKTVTLSKKLNDAARGKIKSTNSYRKLANKKANKRLEKQIAKKEKLIKKSQTQKAILQRTKAANKASQSAAKLAKKKAAKRAVAGKAKGAVVKVLGSKGVAIAGGAIGIIGGGFLIILILMVMIQSFVNRDPIYDKLAPQTAAETVAFDLYKNLKDQEAAWVSGLRDFETTYKNRKDLLYTDEYVSFEEYSNKVNAFKLNLEADMEGDEIAVDDKTFVNPFWRLEFTNTDEYLDEDYRTEVNAFDGANKATIGTNDNVFSRTSKVDSSGNMYTVGLNTGHTSNIKDILSMTDVMYSMEMDTMADSLDDTGLQGDGGIMGCSPEQIEWQSFKDKKLGFIRCFFSNLWAKVKAKLAGGEADDFENPLDKYNFKELKYGATSYDTITNYVMTLFHASHQNQIYLNVEFFDTDNIHKNLEIAGQEVKQEEASKFGICTNPTHKKFYIAVNNDGSNRIKPAIKGHMADGSFVIGNGYYSVGKGSGHEVELDIKKNLEQRDILDPDIDTYPDVDDKIAAPCIDDSYSSNEATYNKILADLADNDGNGCWEFSEGESETDEYYPAFQKDYETWSVRWDNWEYYDIRPERDYKPDNKYTSDTLAKAKEFIGNMTLWGSKFYYTDGDYCGLFREYTPNYSNDLNYFQKMLDERLQSSDHDWGGFHHDVGKRIYYKYELNKDKNTFTVTTVKTLPDAIEEAGLAKKGETIIDDIDGLDGWKVDGSDSKTGTFRKYRLTKMTKKVYRRNCKGHTFVYCGGHIAVHNHGSVYSATNDEIAVAGIVDDEVNPSADTFDVYEAFDGEIKGKYNEDKFPTEKDLESYYDDSDLPKLPAANVLAQSGKGDPVWKDEYQGSYVGMQGLNLYIDGENWGKGMDLSALVSPATNVESIDPKDLPDDLHPSALTHYWRDIFDVDCSIKYGKNVFPTFADPSNYKSWTASNMQLALNRMSIEWNDVYGFEIPYEIGDWFEPEMVTTKDKSGQDVYHGKEDDDGHLIKSNSDARGYVLSEDDIDAIVDGVKVNYPAMDKAREDSIRQTLKLVGRGYDEGREAESESALPHRNSVFNRDSINTNNDDEWASKSGTHTISFEGSSSMSYSTAFVDYIRYLSGASYVTGSGFNKNSGFTNSHDLRPGDYIIHFPKSSDSLDKALGFGTSDGSCKDMFDKTLLLTDEFKMKNANTIKDYYSEKQACVYIGKLSSSITLSTGQVLDADVKLIVDMNAQSDNLNKCGHKDAKGKNYKEGNVGLISLHGTKASKFWDWDYETTYWWLQNSSNRADDDTRFYSFGG